MEEVKLNETQKGIIEEMKKNPQVTYWELSMKLNRNESNIGRNIRLLRLMGVIRRLGPRYKSVDRRWEVLK